jgi:hypothetical protein
MGLQLSLSSVVQSNDATTLTLTDGTGLYNVTTNPGGWTTPNTAFADIDGSTSDLGIQIIRTDSAGTIVIYDNIDYFDLYLVAPTSIDDLVFTITCNELKVSGHL